jgi:surface protein
MAQNKLRIKGLNSGSSYNPIITFTKPNYGTQVDVVSQYLTLKRGNNQGLFNTNEGTTYTNTIGGGLNHLWMMEPMIYYPHIEGTVNLGQNPNEIDLTGVHIVFSYNGYDSNFLSLGSFIGGNNGFTETVDENGNTIVTIDSTPWQDNLTSLPSLNINDLTMTLKYVVDGNWTSYEGGTINLTISQNQFGTDTTDTSSGNYRTYWKTDLWNTFNPSDIDIPTLINEVYDGSNVNESSPMVPWVNVHGGNPPLMVGKEMIMLDTQDSKFYKIKFTQWTSGNGGGGLSYTRQLIRTTPPPPSQFISVWDTTLGKDPIITLPLVASGNYNFSVNWGDGNTDTITAWDQSERTHAYATGGVYTVTITGTIEGWSGVRYLTQIIDIGCLKLGNEGAYFQSSEELTSIGGTFDLTGVTNMDAMFAGCKLLTSVNGISSWDVSNVTSMSNIFNSATAFNQNIGGWNVSNVNNMFAMFAYATSFNQYIKSWNVSSVTNMTSMFEGATAFNGDITAWNVSSVTNMSYMFIGATSFNQNISGWDISNVTNMSGFMQGKTTADYSYYDDLLNAWSLLTLQNGVDWGMGSIEYTSAGATARQDIIDNYSWTINDGGELVSEFISVWDTTLGFAVPITLPLVESGNYNFTVNWGDGNTDTITAWNQAETTHTYAEDGTYTVTITGTIEGWAFGGYSACATKLISITDIGLLKLGNHEGYFQNCQNLTTIGGTIDLTGVTNMNAMFAFCYSLTSVNGIELWDVSSVTSMSSVFAYATAFNQDISGWDISNVLSGKGGNMVDFMYGKSTANYSYYDNLLNAWSQLTLNSGVDLGMGSIEYTSAGAAARASIISNYSWTISDGGLAA